MNFAKNLIGGLIIMVFAGVIGIAQNAVRGNPIKLVATITKPVPSTAAPPAGTQSSAKSPSSSGEMDAGDVDASPDVTTSELAAGEVSMNRMKFIVEGGTTIIIDARDEAEFAEGHIPGALNIPTEHFYEYEIYDLAPMDAMVVVYCQGVTCDLADKLIQEMRLMEYQNIVLYRGGWDEWFEAGLPTEAE